MEDKKIKGNKRERKWNEGENETKRIREWKQNGETNKGNENKMKGGKTK